MRRLFLPGLIIFFIFSASCRDKPTTDQIEDSSSTNQMPTLPPDAIALTKPLIKGRLYKEASLEEGSVINFDTSQQIQILDTTDALFIKARIVKDTATYTGYVLKAILPE